MEEGKAEYLVVLKDLFSQEMLKIEEATAKGAVAMDHAISKTDGLKDGLHGVTSKVVELVAAYASFETVKSSYEVFEKQKLTLVDLGQTYKNNAAYTNESLQSLKDLADAQEQKTGVFKEDTEVIEMSLLKHHDLSIAYSDLIPVVEDFAKATGKDAVESGELLARALGQPAQAMRLLKSAGIDLTMQQHKVIESLVETGHIAQAQSYIFEQLKSRFHDTAEEMYKNDPGRQLAVSWREAQVEIGNLSEELLVDAMPTIKELIKDVIEVVHWFEKNKDAIETVGKALLVTVVTVKAYTLATGAAKLATEGWMLIMGESAVIDEASTAVGGLTTEVEGLSAALEANPFGLVIAGLVGIGVAAQAWWTSKNTDIPKQGELTDADKKKISDQNLKEGQYDAFQKAVPEVQQATLQNYKDQIAKAKDDLVQINKDFEFASNSDLSTNNIAVQNEANKKHDLLAKIYRLDDIIQNAHVKPVKDASGKLGKGGLDALGSSLDSSKVSGGKQVVINITMRNLAQFGDTVIHGTSDQKSVDDIHDKIVAALGTGLNDAQIVASIG